MTGTGDIPEQVLVDTSVLVKWFHAGGESEVTAARAVLAAHRAELLAARILDLTVYELGNILVRSVRWSAEDAADQLDDLLVICGPPVVLAPPSRRDAAELAVLHGLTFYDAGFAAAARACRSPLITADRQLLDAGLGESATRFVERLGLVEHLE